MRPYHPVDGQGTRLREQGRPARVAQVYRPHCVISTLEINGTHKTYASLFCIDGPAPGRARLGPPGDMGSVVKLFEHVFFFATNAEPKSGFGGFLGCSLQF